MVAVFVGKPRACDEGEDQYDQAEDLKVSQSLDHEGVVLLSPEGEALGLSLGAHGLDLLEE